MLIERDHPVPMYYNVCGCPQSASTKEDQFERLRLGAIERCVLRAGDDRIVGEPALMQVFVVSHRCQKNRRGHEACVAKLRRLMTLSSKDRETKKTVPVQALACLQQSTGSHVKELDI